MSRAFAAPSSPVSQPRAWLHWLFAPNLSGRGHLITRWLFLRALALIYFSAFYSLAFQIKGLIGPEGILPITQYLPAIARALGPARFWFAPTLLWLSPSSDMLMALCWIGMLAALAALLNLWPRLSFLVCFVCFLSFVVAASDFSGYQSDGMLLEAGFLALFFVPSGLRPGWGEATPPSRVSLFLLQWEWFRIYFESGMVKLLSGDEQWRNFSAMDQYYQNGPLPTWVGWYVQHLPHRFHATTVALTLVMEFGVVLLLFCPRRLRLICFCIVTPWEAGVILTANYTFLNYLVLSLGILLLDDGWLRRWIPRRLRTPDPVAPVADAGFEDEPPLSILHTDAEQQGSAASSRGLQGHLGALRLAVSAVALTWIAYVTTAKLILIPLHDLPLPMEPIRALEPFRIANQYGLFAVMTRGRYEIEFQGSNDGQTWIAYPFRYKPQALNERPGIYAPYQPRFDWNLWFSSLGEWRQNQIVPLAEEHLLQNDRDVLALFRSNPFAAAPPKYVRAVLWQYWFTSLEEKRRTGNWWRRELLGLYAPELTTTANGEVTVVAMPMSLPPHD
ncbi:lipase maturation factor family protein [Silvibacterium dinghuense]|uniref:Lipase maturation factor 2 n=1 Tax=Silvibacterium dinghuense TaxID=1560006 RepID=A0A4Q1SG65_9BACT|nr:lipase maturation factor family protein [Silvibacterium dinghuense]RXS96514.1 lipase maturation factor family protein [Silvibacterium dinghuense]GGG91439.1 membrane protein [Silvibacterium dinghuense]